MTIASAMKSWANIFQSSFNPAKAKVMVVKAIKRVSDSRGMLTPAQNRAWLEQNAVPLEVYVEQEFAALKQETQDFCADLQKHADEVLSQIPHDLGGGGGAPLLYAIVRHMKPEVVVETGVAAGFSSASILAALNKNGVGELYSSDFPYFRIENAEKYIGIVVPEKIKNRWSLHIKGDRYNIPSILDEIEGPIDLVHYDSDKSYDGRNFVLNSVFPHLSARAVVIVDDIQDNCHFHDFVVSRKEMNWSVFFYNGKYIGMIRPV